MKLFISTRKYFAVTVFTALQALLFVSCNDLISIDPPKTEVLTSAVFAGDASADAAVIGMFSDMVSSSSANLQVGYGCSLSADETGTSAIYPFSSFNTNTLSSDDPGAASYWTRFYKIIYEANSIIENSTVSTGMSENGKKLIIGQAKFVRALEYFYLVNMFGAVPLTTTTDVNTNKTMGRSAVDVVYDQIISDLKDAEVLLPTDYSYYDGKRDRPIAKAATAFLAKAYLYTKDYQKAEEKATEVIANNELYELLPANEIMNVFLKDSRENILGLNTETSTGHNVTNEQYYYEYGSLYGTSFGPVYALTTSLANAFESGDARKEYWIGSFDYDGATYYYSSKYKDYDGTSSPLEYSVLFRLAEQYLIRAEARIMQAKISDGVDDLNVIRTRANLPNITAQTESAAMDAVMQERRVELFLEDGNRWFDLKRTNRAGAVLSILKPDTWKSTAILYPIPLNQIKLNPHLVQNEGY